MFFVFIISGSSLFQEKMNVYVAVHQCCVVDAYDCVIPNSFVFYDWGVILVCTTNKTDCQ